ncbi:acid-sensing ion channel 1-like [Babylonia areolata]|uniref:acid-sensing ion channel 1-like n=1 Tax=Babylonia areolata TaxID=304850 RepID=UPI003FD0AD8A
MNTKVRSESDLQISGSDVKQKDGKKKKKWRLWNLFTTKSIRQIISDMTIHGVPHVADKEIAVWNRLLWLLGVCSSLGVFLAMFYWLQEDYYQYPYKTMVSSAPTYRLPFPAVSICNINTMDVSRVAYAESLRDIMSWTAFGPFNMHLDEAEDQHWQVLNMSAQTILEQTDPGVNETIRACFYDGGIRNCDELFDVTYWSLTRCLTLDVSKIKPASGTTNLRVVVNVNEAGYVVQEDKSVGVKLFVHPVNDAPNFNAHTCAASPGFSTHVALKYQQMRMLGYPYKSYGDRYCVKTIDTKGLPVTGSKYHLMPCLKHRAVMMAHQNCSCRTPFQTDPDRPDCTLYQMLTCVIPILDVLTKENLYNASASLGCPLPCDIEQYPASITFSYFPSSLAEHTLIAKNLIENGTNIRGNYLELNIYYSELILHKMEYVAEYSAMSIMGSIGGNLGFFLGASVVSVAEILELAIIGFLRLLQRLSRAVFTSRV